MVRVIYRFTDDLMEEGFRIHRKRAYWRVLIFPSALLVGLLVGSRGNLNVVRFTAIHDWWFLLLLMSAWVVGAPYFAKKRFRKSIRESPAYGLEITWTLTPQGISSQSEGGRMEVVWARILEIREGSTGFLLYPQKALFYYLPFSAFSSPEQIAEARSYFPPEKMKA